MMGAEGHHDTSGMGLDLGSSMLAGQKRKSSSCPPDEIEGGAVAKKRNTSAEHDSESVDAAESFAGDEAYTFKPSAAILGEGATPWDEVVAESMGGEFDAERAYGEVEGDVHWGGEEAEGI